MARWRAKETLPEDLSSVPAELTDWDSPAWAEPAVFRRWIKANLTDHDQLDDRRIEYLCTANGHGQRYDFAVITWAIANGFEMERSLKSPDWERLRQAGIRRMPSLERARRRLIMNPAQGGHL